LISENELKNQYFYLFISYLFFNYEIRRDLIKKEPSFLRKSLLFKLGRTEWKIGILTNLINQVVTQNFVFYNSAVLLYSIRNIDRLLIHFKYVIIFILFLSLFIQNELNVFIKFDNKEATSKAFSLFILLNQMNNY